MSFFSSLFRRAGIIKKLFSFLREKKMWWLIPLIIIILVFALFLIFGQYVAPYIYPLF